MGDEEFWSVAILSLPSRLHALSPMICLFLLLHTIYQADEKQCIVYNEWGAVQECDYSMNE